uniref:Uncharacterized protein n=1 Tax=Arundo donax TaxID=35708 RepID=A0A0A9B9Z7_ARUDO
MVMAWNLASFLRLFSFSCSGSV